MSVTITFTIDEAEYRALAAVANARNITLPVLYRSMGRNLAAAVADGRTPIVKPKPVPPPKLVRTPSPSPSGRSITTGQVARIRELHTAPGQMSAKRVGELVGVSENTVRDYIKKLGLTPHPRGARARVEAAA